MSGKNHLCFVESYTHIHFLNGTKVISTNTLKHFADLLPEDRFCRIHHAHLINLKHAVKYEGGRSGAIKMSNGLLLEVSQRKRKELLTRFEK